MKTPARIASIIVFFTAAVLFAQRAGDGLITSDSLGDIKLGMTVAQAGKALPGLKLERTSDGEGIALIAVNRGEETIMTLYAGEEDNESQINNAAKIEIIEVWSKDFQTAERVHPGMTVAAIEEKYGKVKEISKSEIESREYAEFERQPKGLLFRVRGKSGDAGIYKEGQNTTTEFAPDAYLFSIAVNNR